MEDNDSGGDISAIISDLNVSKDENICIFRVFRNRHSATAMAKQLSLAGASHGRGPHSCGNWNVRAIVGGGQRLMAAHRILLARTYLWFLTVILRKHLSKLKSQLSLRQV